MSVVSWRFELLLIFKPTKMKGKWMGFVPTLALFNFENLHSWHRALGVGSHFGSSINTVKKSALVLASWCNPFKSPWLFTTVPLKLIPPLKSILQFIYGKNKKALLNMDWGFTENWGWLQWSIFLVQFTQRVNLSFNVGYIHEFGGNKACLLNSYSFEVIFMSKI